MEQNHLCKVLSVLNQYNAVLILIKKGSENIPRKDLSSSQGIQILLFLVALLANSGFNGYLVLDRVLALVWF